MGRGAMVRMRQDSRRIMPGSAVEQQVAQFFWPIAESLGCSKRVATIQKILLERSLRRIKLEVDDAIERGVFSGARGAAHAEKLSRESTFESFRQAVITQRQDDTRGKKGKAMMLSTSAEVPDFEHALLEGQEMDEAELLKHLERFGCQHTLAIL
jgi:hypothetical protein